MVNQNQREKFQTLIRGTIISLCQNVLEHKSEVKIDVFVGITLDKREDFHFSIVETLRADDVSGSVEAEKLPEANASSHAPHQSGSMLEKLMVHDITSNKRTSITSAALPKSREVSSTTVNERFQSSSLSYSELLRSFGEMSRQDKPCGHSSSSASCPTLLNTLNSAPSSHILEAATQNPINQAQVVIPINFAIHSPSTRNSHHSFGSFGNKEQESYESRSSQWSLSSVSSSKVHHYDCEHPDSTYTMPDPHGLKSEADDNPYNVKIKQEVLSDDEMKLDQQTEPDYYRHSHSSVNDSGRLAEGHSSGKDNSSQPSSKGILMSLLCEKSPGVQLKKRGRPRKKSDDPLYVPPKQSKPSSPAKSASKPENKDSRVLIGLTDYLSGFKEGDLRSEKPPRCVFSGPDISAKTRKVVLLNSGPFSTVRMVHRSLQGLRATEISEVMQEMTKPRQHPEYVGEYKAITMPKVRQGRRFVGVFYKCPPELLKPNALAAYDIQLEDYIKFYEQVYKYDRTPQPPYFQAIEVFSPFSGTYSGKRSWREDPNSDPTAHLGEIHSASGLIDCPPGEDMETDMTKPDETLEAGNIRVTNIKQEKVDWDSMDDFNGDEQNITTGQTWKKLKDSSPGLGEESSDSSPEQPTVADRESASSESTADDYNPNLVTYVPKDFGQQPVFPQPMVVSNNADKHHFKDSEKPADEDSQSSSDKESTTCQSPDTPNSP